MSDLSVAAHTVEKDIVSGLNAVAGFFKSFTSPSTQAQAASVGQQLAQAAASAEALLPTVAEEATNAVLAMIPGGSQYAALADQIIEKVIANLTAKKSTASPPVP